MNNQQISVVYTFENEGMHTVKVTTTKTDGSVEEEEFQVDVGEENTFIKVKRFYLKDHLGSTRAVVDELGELVESYDYYPFGLQMPGRIYMAGQAVTRNLFTNKELDSETNNYYFGARYYDPAIGRWLAVDVAGQYHSPYVYCGNNPINVIDTDGLYGMDVHYFRTRDLFGEKIAGINQDVDNDFPAEYIWFPSNYPKHFMSRGDAEILLEEAMESGIKEAFATALHSFQDSFRHPKYESFWPLGHVFATAFNELGLSNDPDADLMVSIADRGSDLMMLIECLNWRKKWNGENPDDIIVPFDITSLNETQWLFDNFIVAMGDALGAGINKDADMLHEQHPNYIIIVDGVRYY